MLGEGGGKRLCIMAHVAIKAHILSRVFFFFFTSFQFMTIHHIDAKVVFRGCRFFFC